MGSSALLRTTISLLLLQVFSRLFSFSLNQLLIRSTTPQALGVATLSLEVIRDTGLFLLREGLRGAVVRTRTNTAPSKSTLQAYKLPFCLSPIIALLFALFFISLPSLHPSHLVPTLFLYSLSGIIELASEPQYLYTLTQWETLTSARVRVEGLAVVGKAVGTLAVIQRGGEDWALPAYGVGQVVYSLVILVGMMRAVGTSVPTVEEGAGNKKEDEGTGELRSLAWGLTKQSVVKQLLTEGDKIVVGRWSKVEDQGGYAVALNYGSLLARIVFAPLEESSRLFFSSTSSLPLPTSLPSLSSHLSLILLLHTHLTLIFTLLLPSYTTPLLYHLLGPRWAPPHSNAASILTAYAYYLPFLAFNGILEAFFQSIAGERWLKKGNWAMAGSSLSFGVAVWLGRKWGVGETGLIIANCVGMSWRIVFSAWFTVTWFGEKLEELRSAPGGEGQDEKVRVGGDVRRNLSPRRWMPKIPTLLVFSAASFLVKRSEAAQNWRTLRGMSEHVGIGAVSGLACLGVIILMERRELARLWRRPSSLSSAAGSAQAKKTD